MKGRKIPWIFGIVLTVALASSAGNKRPHFTVEPPTRVLWPSTRGAFAVCRATGHPTPDVNWVTAEGQILTTIPGLRHVISDGRLVVGARRSVVDAGAGGSSAVLRCKATNKAGTTLSRPMILQPVEDSVLSHSVRQLTPAEIGGSVVLRCEVSPQMGLIEVKWIQDGLTLSSGFIETDSRWTTGAGGLLVGVDLTQADMQAEYSCLVLDTPSPVIKLTSDDSSWLEMKEINSIEAQIGDTVILPCIMRHVGGHTITWQRQEASGIWIAQTPGEGIVKGGTLVLPNVRPHHALRYACSTGSESSSRLLIRLTVMEPLTVTVTPNPLILGTGGTGIFNCTVKGGRGGGITLSWQHEGRPLHAPQARLSLGPVRSHHAGLYQCTAFDHTESAVSGAELMIADRPPRLISTFSEAVTRIGQSIVLRCAATGIPPPRILWTLDDRPLPAAPDKYSVNTRAEALPSGEDGVIVSTLSVTIRTADEGGRYGCNATNSGGSHAHHARLNIFGPPNIRYLPPVHVKTNTDVTLNCPYSGYPIKEVIWRREDGSAIKSGLESNEELGILRLNSVRSTDAGNYICEVRAESGELAKRTVRVEVHKPPKIMPFHFPEELEVGGSTQATCSLVSGDKPILFSWHKDNLPIPSVLKVEQKNMDFFSILVIHNLSSAHTGEYSCRATNDFGTISHTAPLIVKESPSWIWRAQNTSVSVGAAVLLPCSAKGQPLPRISWEFSSGGNNWHHILWGQSDSPESGEGSVLLDGTIWLRAVTSNHEGWYRCTARVQHSFLHHSFYLDVREPPKLSRGDGGGETRWVVRGSTARLICTVRGEPEIHLHWTHDSRPLSLHGSGGVETKDIGNGIKTSEITISHAGPEHAGDYKCLARNLYGNDELSFRLFVKERPNIPEEVRISELWSRKARVTWRAARGVIVSHYTLQYRVLTLDIADVALSVPLSSLISSWDTHEVVNVTLANSDLLHVASEGPGRAGALVTGLAPDTRYVLRLAAYNDVGASPYTPPLHFTTREEAPGGVPRDIIVRALRARELLVTWQPPPKETWHGTLLGYTIRWWEVSEEGKGTIVENSGSESGASADATSTTLRGLKAATRYGVTIRAYNAAGTGPLSPPHYRHTIESPPNGSPELLPCISSGSTSLRVSWHPPALEARGGVITHYTLQYTRRDSDPLLPPQDAYLRIQGEDTIVSRLTPYAEYEIRVRAHNAAGDGPLSAPQFCRTDEDVPSAPGGMKLIALSERSLRASWLPPSQPNGKLTHYTLYVKDLSGTQEPNVSRINACIEGEECMKPLRGLRPGRTYEAWVRAATSAGEGPPSTVVACQTSALAPARISSFGGLAMESSGSSLSLRCVVGGVPPPAKRWLRAGNLLHPIPPFHLEGDALLIKGLELSHADNYTCVAENPHGSDSVTWRVIVLRPPAPPSLALLEARSRELELDVRPTPRAPGHALPKAYTLHWRLAAPEGEWRVQPANPGPATLSGLRCGSAYRVYGSAGGAPGTEIAVRTSGGPPSAPPDNRWIRANATHAKFDTSMWSDGGCGPVALKLEWAGPGAIGARDVPVGGEVILSGLTPGARYRVVARSSNEAGLTREVYEFTTLPLEGSFAEEVDAPFPATAGELAVLLALCAALSLAALTILAILLRRKRSDGVVARIATNADKTPCGTYGEPPHPTPKLLPDPPDVYEISPYATFAGGPGITGAGSRAYTLQLRALARHDDDAAPPAHSSCCDVPSAPGGMKLIALSERSLRASWLPLLQPNGKLTHYTLYVKDLSGTQEPNVSRINACIEGEECMKPLRGLRPGRTYEAWVRAATSAGEGPPSTVVACQTSALAPARISSFGGLAMESSGSSLSLRCVVGGVPPPAKRWLRAGNLLHPIPPFHLEGDALLIKGLELSHADNYTCVAENPHGSDSVTWRVIVLRPPAPPSLALLEARSRELELDVRPTPRAPGHALPKAYTLHWRLAAPEGEWRVQPANPGPATLSGLRCGSAYRVYGSAGGASGTEIVVRTSGGPPSAPPDNRWIRANATHAKFDTSMWSDGGCGPVALKLEWAGPGAIGARDVPVGGEVILSGLTPGARYRVVARSSNEAGLTREVYEFTTLPLEGSFAEEVDAPFPATAGELAVLLALCAALSLAALTILAILLRRKRSDGVVARIATNADKTPCGTYGEPPHPTPKLLPDPPDVYEISPYATFAGGPGITGAGSRAYTLQLRALARHDDDAAPPAHSSCCDEETCVDTCDDQRQRRRRRHYCPDHGCSLDSGS